MANMTSRHPQSKPPAETSMPKTALVLEGGGLRGVYSSGVLRYFSDQRLSIPYVIGVSAGACNGSNYISGQAERNRIVNINYVKDRRYISYLRMITKGELFGMSFLFDTLPNSLEPFDFDAFCKSRQRLVVTVTDCSNGLPVYFDQFQSAQDFLTILRASCSIPLAAPMVHYAGMDLMDGGIADSVPIRKSIADGNKKHILILTRPKGYRKKPSPFLPFIKLKYRQYPGLRQAMEDRHLQYNQTMDRIDEMEAKGEAFVIRPSNPLIVGRVERSRDKLIKVYDLGYKEAKRVWQNLCRYIEA